MFLVESNSAYAIRQYYHPYTNHCLWSLGHGSLSPIRLCRYTPCLKCKFGAQALYVV